MVRVRVRRSSGQRELCTSIECSSSSVYYYMCWYFCCVWWPAHQPAKSSSQSQPASGPQTEKLASPTGRNLSTASAVV